MKPTAMQRFRYWFDNVMAKGIGAVVVLLALLTLLLVIVIGVFVLVFGVRSPGEFLEVLWGNLMRTLDPGTMGGDEGWGFRIFMLLVTLGGLFIVASLIGVIANAFDQKIDELRKGKSKVIERDHTLILGWSPKVFQIVSELCIANESRGKSAIVILAEQDKVEMEDACARKCRTAARRASCAAPATRWSSPTSTWSRRARPGASSCWHRRARMIPTST